MSGNWQTTTSLSYLQTDGALPSGRGGPDAAQASSLVFSTFGQNPNDFINQRGVLLGERPWMFKSQFLYQFPAEFLVAVNYNYQSGRAWPRRARVSGLNLFTNINAEVRDGSRRVEAWNLLDVRVQKMFNIGSQARIAFFLDALNLFNEGTNEDVLSRFGTSDVFDVRSEFLPPRRVQLGVKFAF